MQFEVPTRSAMNPNFILTNHICQWVKRWDANLGSRATLKALVDASTRNNFAFETTVFCPFSLGGSLPYWRNALRRFTLTIFGQPWLQVTSRVTLPVVFLVFLDTTLVEPAWLWNSFPEARNWKETESGLQLSSRQIQRKTTKYSKIQTSLQI